MHKSQQANVSTTREPPERGRHTDSIAGARLGHRTFGGTPLLATTALAAGMAFGAAPAFAGCVSGLPGGGNVNLVDPACQGFATGANALAVGAGANAVGA